MEISPRFEGVTGTFDLDTGRLVSVPFPKHTEVLLCLAEQMNIPFANIKLHSSDSYVDAAAVLADATALGAELAKRWNEYPGLKALNNQYESTLGDDAVALKHGLQECAELLGLASDANSSEIVAALREKLTRC